MRILFGSLFALLILLAACGGDDDKKGGGGSGDGILTAAINADDFTADKDAAQAVLTNGAGGSNKISLMVTGENASTKQRISFTLYDYVELGAYQLRFGNSDLAYYYENIETVDEAAWISPDYSISDANVVQGTIAISEMTETRVKGTFSFTAREDGGDGIKEVTEGSFDLPLKRQGF